MEPPATGPLEFRLLGPIEARRDGRTLPVGGRRQQALLALLLLDAGRPVSADRLVDELWDGAPPAGAATTLRAYVSKLRGALGPAAPISSSAHGYALHVEPDVVDVHHFVALVGNGGKALAAGRMLRASEHLGAALDLWRGAPFVGFDAGVLRDEAARLEGLRLLALESRIEADLGLGLDVQLVDELEALLHEHPYRERLWHQLMLALYRGGRQAEALAVYRRAGTLFDEQLGLEPGEELRELEQAILRQDVPAAQPPEQRHNLPSPVTSFVGRESELADVERMLGEQRLVTLTGVGGAGKTRLALEVAARSVPDWRDGVFFVDLSALVDPELVPGHVAAALDVREQQNSSVVEQLAKRLREAELLLLLDNCEHLRAASAELTRRLLADSPGLRVLATSRAPLGVPGEIDYGVPPLSVPGADAGVAEVRSSEAVRLFLARAQGTLPNLRDDDAALDVAASICRELDGLPLAIELAAARTKAFSLEEIATRLSDRFRFLVSWRRLTPARHRTLAEAIGWSYELLAEDERELLARLSVFAGGFTLAAVTESCLDGDEMRAVELIGQLVDASLVVPDVRQQQTRFRLLETVRQYAGGRLDELSESAATRDRHAAYFLALVEDLWTMQLADLGGFVERLRRDSENLRSALSWSRETGNAEQLLRLTKGMWRFWWVQGSLSEGRAWLDAALEQGAQLDPALRAEALEGAAGLAWADGDLARARELAQEAQTPFEANSDLRGIGACQIVLGHVALAQEDYRAAGVFFERSRELAEQLGGAAGAGTAAVATHNLGSVALSVGDLAEAQRQYETALAIYRAQADDYGVALSELFLGFVAVERGRHDDAAALFARTLPAFHEIGFRHYTARCLEGVAAVARSRGDANAAAQLLGAASAIRERSGRAPTPATERVSVATRAALEQEDAWAEGHALSEDEAIAKAEGVLAG